MRARFGARPHVAERGAAAVEMALVLPLLVMLVFGITTFGISWFRAQQMQAAAREGGRVAAVGFPVEDIQRETCREAPGAFSNDCVVSPPDLGDLEVTVGVRDSTDPALPFTPMTSATDVPCDETAPDDRFVRVEVVLDNAGDYGFTIPFVTTVAPDYQSTGVFKCEL